MPPHMHLPLPTRPHPHRVSGTLRWTIAPVGVALGLVSALTWVPAQAATPPVDLGTATSYAVLAGTTVTNTGPSVISGDLGLSPGTAVPGFPPGQVIAGTIHAADAVALKAKNDLVTAYDQAAGSGPAVDKTSQDLGGQTLKPGVYNAASALALTGTVTLDAEGDPAAVFVLQAGSTLVTASSSRVDLIGGAQACHVFWQVGSSATLGTGTRFVGSVLALTSITAQTGATVEGRLLARNGQVALDTNTITRPGCDTAPPSSPPIVVPSATTTPTAPPSATSVPTPGADTPGADTPSPVPGGPTGGPGSPDQPGQPGKPGQPVVPPGHPETGRLELRGGGTWTAVGILFLLGGAAAALGGTSAAPLRRRRS